MEAEQRERAYECLGVRLVIGGHLNHHAFSSLIGPLFHQGKFALGSGRAVDGIDMVDFVFGLGWRNGLKYGGRFDVCYCLGEFCFECQMVENAGERLFPVSRAVYGASDVDWCLEPRREFLLPALCVRSYERLVLVDRLRGLRQAAGFFP